MPAASSGEQTHDAGAEPRAVGIVTDPDSPVRVGETLATTVERWLRE